ncbi:hypothetical protein C8R48DRAFT_167615 [Suillus tomentosus]|nr:hypothetical protein C8R48DRAFT_167615 [Suillus tomentosus]
MPSLFSKLSQALKTAIPQQTGRPKKRRPFKIARPPLAHNIQCYGYAVSSEWLVRFAEQHCPEDLPDRDHTDYEDIATTRAYELLASLSGIYYLDYRNCLNPPPGGIIPPEWIGVFRGKYDDAPDEVLDAIQIDTVQVFYVCSDRGDFEMRPTQKQLNTLTKLIGHPPQWWVAYGPGPW